MADPSRAPPHPTPLHWWGNRVPAGVRDSFTEDLLPLFRRALNTVALEGVRKH